MKFLITIIDNIYILWLGVIINGQAIAKFNIIDNNYKLSGGTGSE